MRLGLSQRYPGAPGTKSKDGASRITAQERQWRRLGRRHGARLQRWQRGDWVASNDSTDSRHDSTGQMFAAVIFIQTTPVHANQLDTISVRYPCEDRSANSRYDVRTYKFSTDLSALTPAQLPPRYIRTTDIRAQHPRGCIPRTHPAQRPCSKARPRRRPARPRSSSQAPP